MDPPRRFYHSITPENFRNYTDSVVPRSQPTYPGRPAYPALYNAPKQAHEDPLDLSSYHDDAQKAVDNVPLGELTKPQGTDPWSGAHATTTQHQPSHQGIWPSNLPYAKSEPPTNGEGYSSFVDSAYGASLPSNWNAPPYADAGFNNASNDDMSVASDGRLLKTKHQILPCPTCQRIPKNPSDARKHALIHTKPFRCFEHDCTRKGEGFATENDLQRHRKSVHNLVPLVGPTSGYICVSCPLVEGVKRKFWPRRDNFKAHIKRKHPNHDIDQILQLSQHTRRPDDVETVKTVHDSVALQSQIDPDDSQHVTMDLSPHLTGHPSEHGNYQYNSLWPSSTQVDMTTESLIGGMHGHLQYQDSTISACGDGDGLDIVSQIANGASYDNGTVPFGMYKRLRREGGPYVTQQRSDYDEGRHQVYSSGFQTVSTSSSSSSTQSATSTGQIQGEFQCPLCPKKKKRDCDLKKHMKRHTRPYGCTFPSCHKKFGSRNDWKRHESAQHFLQEMWKCGQACRNGKVCMRRPFRRQRSLETHLRGSDHAMQDPQQIMQACNDSRLGREGHDHFWCGFCQKLVKQKKAMPTAWDERFQHIGDHFDKDGREIGDWVCVEENRKKKDILPDVAKQGCGTGKMRFTGEEDELDEYAPDLTSMFISSREMLVPRSYGNGSAMMYLPSPSSPNKRKHEEDIDAAHEIL